MTGPVVHGAQLGPGDVLVCDGTAGLSKVIEVGAVLVGEPAASHVAIYHHSDANGTPWAIEGRPGGVGWRDATDYARDPRTITNADEPKTQAQRETISVYAEKMLGTSYDWVHGIAEDALLALDLPALWKPEKDTGVVPCQVVCSSLAAWVYDRADLDAPHPEDWRHVTPGAWALFIAQQGWRPHA